MNASLLQVALVVRELKGEIGYFFSVNNMGNVRYRTVCKAFKAYIKGYLISQQTYWYKRNNEAHAEIMNMINKKETVDKNEQTEDKTDLCTLRN